MSTSPPPPAEADAPLAQLAARLPAIVAQTGHAEMWGVALDAAAVDEAPSDPVGADADADADAGSGPAPPSEQPPLGAPCKVVLRKFLRANAENVDAAEKQLAAALAWRKRVNPAGLVQRPFDERRFGGLGFVTVHGGDAGARDTVITWNIYGAVSDNMATFGNVQQFIEWRAALMELSIQKLRLNDITEPLASGADDPYQMIQVHDYRSVSFFRMDPDVKAASRETIQAFSTAYPELLSHKYFVNVPTVMGWVFGAMKLFLAPATLRKFHPMASGAGLASELKAIGPSLPSEYGGQGASVRDGSTVLLTGEGTEAVETPAAETAQADAASKESKESKAAAD